MSAIHTARHAVAGMLCGLCLSLLPQAAGAGAIAVAGFQVAVRLVTPSNGTCLSEPVGAPTPVTYQVTCTSEHFVSMGPSPIQPFVGGTGRSTFLFHMSGGGRGETEGFSRGNEPALAVTALQVSSAQGAHDGQTEILVSF